MVILKIISISIFAFVILWINNAYCIEVEIPDGKLSGVQLVSRVGKKFYGFLGIPYAKPPIGELRFQSPQEPDPWTEIRDATKDPPRCIQKEYFFEVFSSLPVSGEEDCLYINVYTHRPDKATKLPVMVFIHGGGYECGTGILYGPHYFMDKPVVLVTFNYRLGALGFLSNGDKILPGNYGLKDQSAALKWIQRNINYFGGDPDNVLIFGQSAGASSVNMHMLSPLSKGLFHKAISHSGSANAAWNLITPSIAQNRAAALAVLTSCPFDNSHQLVECLRDVPAKKIVEAQSILLKYAGNVIAFPVVVEPEDTQTPFISKDVSQWEELNTNIPWILGITSEEAHFITARQMGKDREDTILTKDEIKGVLPTATCYRYTAKPEHLPQISNFLFKEYFGNGQATNQIYTMGKLLSDIYFTHPITETALKYKGQKYVYYYDHKNNRSLDEFYSFHPVKHEGVSHGDDLLSFFSMDTLFTDPLNGEDRRISEQLIDLWVNFASTGNPNGLNQPFQWEPVQSDNVKYLSIKTKSTEMAHGIFSEVYNKLKDIPFLSRLRCCHKKNKDEL